MHYLSAFPLILDTTYLVMRPDASIVLVIDLSAVFATTYTG